MATVEDFLTRLPPQNLDAERSVLGSMLFSNDAVDEVASFLKSTHFYHDAHQQIYGAICRMRERGRRERIGQPGIDREIVEGIRPIARA